MNLDLVPAVCFCIQKIFRNAVELLPCLLVKLFQDMMLVNLHNSMVVLCLLNLMASTKHANNIQAYRAGGKVLYLCSSVPQSTQHASQHTRSAVPLQNTPFTKDTLSLEVHNLKEIPALSFVKRSCFRAPCFPLLLFPQLLLSREINVGEKPGLQSLFFLVIGC